MRIDRYLAEKFGSRTKSAEAIGDGLVLVNGKTVAPSYDYKDGDKLEFLTPKVNFVSHGGYKLQKALEDFGFSVAGKVFADVGASTGGFTDCLLKNGANKVYCIDVGESQLDKSLKDKNVVVIDNFNARNLTADLFEEKLDGVVIDVSFISLTYILPSVAEVIEDGASVIALIKPQFECESRKVGKNGIVRDSALRKKIVIKICKFAEGVGLIPLKLTTAPEREGKNKEFLLLMRKGSGGNADIDNIIKYVKL